MAGLASDLPILPVDAGTWQRGFDRRGLIENLIQALSCSVEAQGALASRPRVVEASRVEGGPPDVHRRAGG